ncbi:MAG: DUF3551 domain-containing protein [Pseudorhodoplanes sp.]
MHALRSARIRLEALTSTTVLAAAALLLALAVPALAQRQTSPYCANFGDSGGRDCSYPSFQACQAAVRGVGGQCQVNPFSPSNPPRRNLFQSMFGGGSYGTPPPSARPPIVRSAYCAFYNDGGTNCGFPTLQACRQAVSAVSGVCRRNPRAS